MEAVAYSLSRTPLFGHTCLVFLCVRGNKWTKTFGFVFCVKHNTWGSHLLSFLFLVGLFCFGGCKISCFILFPLFSALSYFFLGCRPVTLDLSSYGRTISF
jgi:hypothetical protein